MWLSSADQSRGLVGWDDTFGTPAAKTFSGPHAIAESWLGFVAAKELLGCEILLMIFLQVVCLWNEMGRRDEFQMGSGMGRVTGLGFAKGVFVMSEYLGNEFQFGAPRDYVSASAVRKR
jgi:hypothetical protein